MKHKLELDVFTMVGIIFSLVGLPFTCLGIWFARNPEWLAAHGEGDVGLMWVIFLFMGLLLLAVGLSLILIWLRRIRRRNRALEKGTYVWGKVESIQSDWTQRINGWPTMFLVAVAEYDGRHMRFEGPRKHCRTVFPEIGSSVRVYIDPDTDAYAVTDSNGNLF